MPARLHGQKRGTGATVEVLLLEEQAPETWLALVKPGKRLQPGSEIGFPDAEGSLWASVLETDPATGGRLLRFSTTDGRSLWDWLDHLGEVQDKRILFLKPLPRKDFRSFTSIRLES